MNPLLILRNRKMLILYALVKTETCWYRQSGYRGGDYLGYSYWQRKRREEFATQCCHTHWTMCYTRFWNIRRYGF